jgi:chromosome segregation ATPase
MDKPTAIEADLTKARDALTALQDELPQFHALLTDNEADVQKLKTERAALDVQAQARGRAGVAREMLEQHQSDIATARAEVVRLETLARREHTLMQMADHAKTATKHRKALETAVHEGSAALAKALDDMGAAFTTIRDHRAQFAQLGSTLAPEFNRMSRFNDSIQDNAKKAVCEQVARELGEHGVTLTDVLNSTTGTHTPLDTNTRALPTPDHADLLWQVFAETVAKRDRHIYHNVYLPVKNARVYVGAGNATPDRYSI